MVRWHAKPDNLRKEPQHTLRSLISGPFFYKALQCSKYDRLETGPHTSGHKKAVFTNVDSLFLTEILPLHLICHNCGANPNWNLEKPEV